MVSPTGAASTGTARGSEESALTPKRKRASSKRAYVAPDMVTLTAPVPPVEDVGSGAEAHKTQGIAQSPNSRGQ